MAVEIPKINDLYNDYLSNLESELGITTPIFGKNFLKALAAVLAGAAKLQYIFMAKIQKNIFVDLAEPESAGGTLERFGRVKLGRSPFAATPGTYEVSVTGDVGATIQANTTFKSNDNSLNPGEIYVLDSIYTFVAGPNTIQLRSLNSGLNVQLNIGDGLTATAPIANVDSAAIVQTETITPLAAEDLEDYRQKTVLAFQLEPQGGAASDYILWSLDAQGVRRVYPYAKSGFSNEINVFVEATIADSSDGKGTPTPAIISDIEAVIEFDPDTTKPLNERGRRPLGLFLANVEPVTIREIDVVITNYVGLNTDIENTIFNAIKDTLDDIRPFVAGADVVANKNDILSTSKVIFAIQEAVPSSIFDSLDLQVDTISVFTFTFVDGDIPNLNSVTYV